MTKKKGKIKKKMHRQLGADLFNATWDLLDKPDRSADEDEIMIHAAHASAHHWRQVGGPLNFERSNWQISRVYSLLNRPEAALYHARLCLETCLEEGIGDFDLAFAYEAMARAAVVGGQLAEARQYIEKAREVGEQIAKKGDREYFFDELGGLTVQEADDAA